MKEFLAMLREGCSLKNWSNGVELARSLCVEKSGRDFDVLEPQKSMSFRVKLHIEDEDWECSCYSKEDPCIHVVAAAIATFHQKFVSKNQSQAIKKESEATPEKQLLKIGYDLSHEAKQGFRLQRRLIPSDLIIRDSLSGFTSTRVQLPKNSILAATQKDWQVDQSLKSNHVQDGFVQLTANTLSKILPLLTDSKLVWWNNKPIKTNSLRKFDWVRIQDFGPGVTIRIVPNPQIESFISDGACIVAGELTGYRQIPPASIGLTKESLDSKGQYFTREQATLFFSEWYEKIQQKTTIEHIGSNVGETSKVSTYLALEAKYQSETQSFLITPQIVYGNPPIAKMIGNQIITIGEQIPQRVHRSEQRLREKWQQLFTHLPLEKTASYSTHEAQQLAQKSSQSHILFYGPAGKQLEQLITPLKDFKIHFKTDENDIHLSISLPKKHNSHYVLNTKEISRAWNQNSGLLSLPDGKWIRPESTWVEKYGHILETIGNVKNTDDSQVIKRFATYSLAQADPLKLTSTEVHQFNSKATENFSLLKAKLRPYQIEGAKWASRIKKSALGGLLGDEMGLGKTVQMCAILEHRSLIVVPRSLLQNWQAELSKFRPDLNFQVYHGKKRDLKGFQKTKNCVLITSYATLRLDIDKFKDIQWSVAILDEAHTIKNAESQTHQACRALRANTRFALSGTPVENSPLDLLNVLHFVLPGIKFTNINLSNSPAIPSHELNSLRKKIAPFLLRRTKKMVAKDLPPRIEQNILCELSVAEKERYLGLAHSTKLILQEGSENTRKAKIFELILRLRQASCHPKLLPSSDIEASQSSTKLDTLTEMIKQNMESKQKSLIFSQWTGFLDLIADRLAELRVYPPRIDGQTKDRNKQVELFQKDPDQPCMLLSLKAAGTGLNLTAAENVYIMDPWWNPAVESQAADRAHRIGQNKTVMIYRLIAKDTIEEKITALAKQKRQLANLLTDDISMVEKISLKEMTALLS